MLLMLEGKEQCGRSLHYHSPLNRLLREKNTKSCVFRRVGVFYIRQGDIGSERIEVQRIVRR